MEGYTDNVDILDLLKQYVYLKTYREIQDDIKEYYSTYEKKLNTMNDNMKIWLKTQMAQRKILPDIETFNTIFTTEFTNIKNRELYKTQVVSKMDESISIIKSQIVNYISTTAKNNPTTTIDWYIYQRIAPLLKDAYLYIIADIKANVQKCKSNITNFKYNDDICAIAKNGETVNETVATEYITIKESFYKEKEKFYRSVGCKIKSLLDAPHKYPIDIEECTTEIQDLMKIIGSGSSIGSSLEISNTIQYNKYIPDSQYTIIHPIV